MSQRRSSMKDMHSKSFSLSESRIARVPTSGWYRTHSEAPRSSCSCRLPKSQYKLIPYESLPSLIDADINIHQINMLVSCAWIPRGSAPSAIFTLFLRFLTTFSKYPESEICMLWKSIFRLTRDEPLPFADCFQLQVELKIRLIAPVSWCLRFAHRFVASLENVGPSSVAHADCFQLRAGTRLWSKLWFLGSLTSCERNFLTLERFKFTSFAYATADLSFRLPSWTLFDMAQWFLIGSERNWLRWLQEHTGQFKMWNKRWRWFHSSRVKFPVVSMSASWFWCQHKRFGSWCPKLVLSNNLVHATLWVLETCLIVGPLPLMIIFITASLSWKCTTETHLKMSVRLW